MNRPELESLLKFVVEELTIMTYQITPKFFKISNKEKSRKSGVECGSVRVRQVMVKAPVVQASQTNNKGPNLRSNSGGNQKPQLTKPPSLCFVCNDSVSKSFLVVCKTFKTFAKEKPCCGCRTMSKLPFVGSYRVRKISRKQVCRRKTRLRKFRLIGERQCTPKG